MRVRFIIQGDATVFTFLIYEMDENSEVKLSISLKDLAYRICFYHEVFYIALKGLEKIKLIIRQE